MEILRLVAFMVILLGDTSSELLDTPEEDVFEEVLKIDDLNIRLDEKRYVKLEPQIKNNKEIVKEFTLCFRFMMNSLVPSKVFSSPRVRFSIESPSNIIGKLGIFNNEPITLSFEEEKLVPLKWSSFCVVKETKRRDHVIRVYLNSILISREVKKIFSYILPTKANFMEDSSVGQLITGMVTHVMCSSKIVLESKGEDYFYTKSLADKFDLFDWRKVDIQKYASEYISLYEVNVKEMNLQNNTYPYESSPKEFFEACQSCSFVNGVIVEKNESPKTYYWTAFTKVNNTCSNRLLENSTIMDHWEIGEPNGYTKQQCIAYNSVSGLYKDNYCYAKHRSLCIFRPHTAYTLRGIPKFIQEMENYFYSTVFNGEFIFVGLKRNIIRKRGELWEIQMMMGHERILAFYNESRIFPHGVNDWHYIKESGEQVVVPLMLTNCNGTQFTCNDSSCIGIEKVCDDFADCTNAEDENDCQAVNTRAYNKELPPPILVRNERTAIDIKFFLKSVNDIEELENMVELEYRVDMKWKDSRMIYYRLNKDIKAKKRVLTSAEKDMIWIPPLEFASTVEDYEPLSLGRSGHASVVKYSNVTGRYNSYTELFRRIQYDGLEAQIVFEAHLKMRIYCHFQFKSYPFDTQQCRVSMSLPFGIGDKIYFTNEQANNVPIHLLQFQMMSLKLHNLDQVIVAQITLRRVFYNIFWTTYLPTFCLQLVVLLTLFFPPTRFETTIMITLTTTLVIYTLYQSVSSTLPRTAYNKMIDYWLFFSLIMPFFVFLIEVAIEIYGNRKVKRGSSVGNVLAAHGKHMLIFVTLTNDFVYWIYNLFIYF